VPSRRPGGRVAIGESDQRAGHGGSRRPSRLRPPRPGSGRPRSGVRRWFCGEERLDPILVLADPQPPANEPRGNGVEDAAEHEPAAGGDAHVAPRRSEVRIPSAPPSSPRKPGLVKVFRALGRDGPYTIPVGEHAVFVRPEAWFAVLPDGTTSRHVLSTKQKTDLHLRGADRPAERGSASAGGASLASNFAGMAA
jgi:hypothetical protein